MFVECEQELTDADSARVLAEQGPSLDGRKKLRRFYLEAMSPLGKPTFGFTELEKSHSSTIGSKSGSTILYRTMTPGITFAGVRQSDGATIFVEVHNHANASTDNQVQQAIAFADSVSFLQQQSPKEKYVPSAPEPTTENADIFVNADGKGLDPCSVLGSRQIALQPGDKGPQIGSMGIPVIQSTDAERIRSSVTHVSHVPEWQTKTELCILTMDLTTGPESLKLSYKFGNSPPRIGQGYEPSETAGVECKFIPGQAATDHTYTCRTSVRPGAELEGNRYIRLEMPSLHFPAESVGPWLKERMKSVLALMAEGRYV